MECVMTYLIALLTFSRLAMETLIRDAKRNKMRADRMGATGWLVLCPQLDQVDLYHYFSYRYDYPRPKTNQRFAKAVVKSAILGNTMRSKQRKK